MKAMNNWSQEKYRKAWEYAAKMHKGQTYGGSVEGESVDYIAHIGSVAMEIMWSLSFESAYDGDLSIQCALLHDIIEDTSADYSSVAHMFGVEVADGVMALTKDSALPSKEAQMQDSLDRIKLQPKEVWSVKVADRISNLNAPPYYWSEEKKRCYQQEAMLIRDHLTEASEVLLNRLDDKIRDYSQYLT